MKPEPAAPGGADPISRRAARAPQRRTGAPGPTTRRPSCAGRTTTAAPAYGRPADSAMAVERRCLPRGDLLRPAGEACGVSTVGSEPPAVRPFMLPGTPLSHGVA